MSTKVYATIATIILILVSLTQVSSQDYNILPLGNSITASNNGLYSYRYHLWKHLLDDGIEFDFVGTLNENQGGNPTWPDYLGHSFDPDHEGHSGWKADKIMDELPLWLDSYLVDVALIHIGTNDLLADGSDENVDRTIEDIEGIIRVLRMHNPNISIFLAQIIPIAMPVDDAVVKLNAAIPDIAINMDDSRSPIYIVDQYSGIDVATDMMADDVHPNASGEEKMGAAWYNAFVANLPEPVNRWTGELSTSWTQGGNWTLGHVPNGSEDVVINRSASNFPVLNGGLQIGSDCKSLIAESGAELTVGGDVIVQQGATIIFMGTSKLHLGGSFLESDSHFGGGKATKTTGGTYQKSHHYNVFDCTTAFELISAKIYATENQYIDPGYRTFYWATSDGTIQEQKDVWVELGESRVTLNFSIPVGTDHRLGVLDGASGDPTLFRDRDYSGLDYPFAIGEVGSITTSDKGQDFYYWMYDFEYNTGGQVGAGQSFMAFGDSEIRFTGSSSSTIEAGPVFTGGGKTSQELLGNYSGFATFNKFDCLYPFKIISATVYANGSGMKTFFWGTEDGTIMQELEVFVPDGESRVELNFIVTPGINHRLGTSVVSGPPLWRDKADEGLAYPYYIGDVGMFTQSKINKEYYYYLFDLEFTTCFNDVSNQTSEHTLITDGNVNMAGDLTLEPGAYLTVNADDTLSVGGEYRMKTNEQFMSSLINSGELVTIRENDIELTLTPDVWHYVSSPVNNALSGVFTGNWLYSFDEATYGWSSIVSTQVPLTPMQGFNAWVPNNPATLHFSGILTQGEQSIPVTRNEAQANPGWNLVGNPYPSSLDWDAAGGWDKTYVNNTIYFWSGVGAGGGGNYQYYIGADGETPGVGVNGGSNEIPPMQAIFVHASGNGNLSVNDNARIHSSQQYYKSSQGSDIPTVRLEINDGEGKNDETVVRFSELADEGFVGQEDAYKLIASEHPQLYSKAMPDNLAINTLPFELDETIVPLEFVSNQSGLYTLSMLEFIGFEQHTKVYLEDLSSGQVQELTDNSAYSFVYDSPSETNAFLLHFSKLTEVEEQLSTDLMVYAFEKNIHIKLNEQADNVLISVYDMMGHLLVQESYQNQSDIMMPANVRTGNYIVNVHMDSGAENKKVFLK